MNAISFVIIICATIYGVRGSLEQFDEQAWMDKQSRDKYFEYSELTAPALVDAENSVDAVQPETRPPRRHTSHSKKQNSNVIDLFVNAIKKIVTPQKRPSPPKYIESETNKGLDKRLETTNNKFPPTFGNNQDLQLIYLGTKWCGAGDIAKNKRDIGYFYLTDSCCRAHDFCPMALEPQQSKFGLKNTGKFTRSHCDCDNEFYQCLKKVNTMVSNQIGLIYFNILGGQCFKEEHPVKCTKYFRNRCVSYKNDDESQSKHFQWFDNKWY